MTELEPPDPRVTLLTQPETVLLDLLEDFWTVFGTVDGQAGQRHGELPVLTRTHALLQGLGRVDEDGRVVLDAARPAVLAVDDVLALTTLKQAGKTRAARPPNGGWSHTTLASLRFRLSFICRTCGQPVTVCGPSVPGPWDLDGEVSPLVRLTGHEHHPGFPGDLGGSGVTCEVTCPACGKGHTLLVAEEGQAG